MVVVVIYEDDLEERRVKSLCQLEPSKASARDDDAGERRSMKEKTKCSGEGGRMSWSISELRGADEENELR